MKTWLLVAALAVASLVTACSPVQLLCKEVGDRCGGDSECCSFGCIEGVCEANPLPDGPCRTSNDCRSGLVCEGGACKQGQRPDGDVCRSGWDCTSGRCVDGTCTARADCGSPGGTCSSSSECCSGLQCVGGRCSSQACRTSGSTCTESAQCCSNLGCSTGTCSEVCRTSGACTQDNDCCSGYSCMGGSCRNGCGGDGASCDANSECCAGLRCGSDSKCRPGQLGESCTATAECDQYEGLVCNAGSCDYAQCRTSVGARCLDGSDCCEASGLACGTNGACCRNPSATCDPGYGNDGCCEGTVCLNDTGRCGACVSVGQPSAAANDCCTGNRSSGGTCCLPDGQPSGGVNSNCCSGAAPSGTCCSGEGTSCDGSDVCCDGLVCEPSYEGSTSKVCRRPLGAACSPDSFYPTTCQGGSDAWCSGGKCCLEPSAACNSGADCCSGTCNPDGRCAAMPLDGACEGDNTCASGACSTQTSTQNRCCAQVNQACGSSTQCCQWPDGNADWNGTYTCGTSASTNAAACCLATGQACTTTNASHCCSGVCVIKGTGTSGTCQ